jgi:hypothetical protein
LLKRNVCSLYLLSLQWQHLIICWQPLSESLYLEALLQSHVSIVARQLICPQIVFLHIQRS